MDKLIDPKMWTDTYKDVLARTIIIAFYSTGVRVSELVGLDMKDLNFVTHELKVTGKRNKQRIIPFGEELKTTLTAYLQKRDSEVGACDALFVTEKGERVTASQVRTMVKANLAKVSTLKKKSPHVLRHTLRQQCLTTSWIGKCEETARAREISQRQKIIHTRNFRAIEKKRITKPPTGITLNKKRR